MSNEEGVSKVQEKILQYCEKKTRAWLLLMNEF